MVSRVFEVPWCIEVLAGNRDAWRPENEMMAAVTAWLFDQAKPDLKPWATLDDDWAELTVAGEAARATFAVRNTGEIAAQLIAKSETCCISPAGRGGYVTLFCPDVAVYANLDDGKDIHPELDARLASLGVAETLRAAADLKAVASDMTLYEQHITAGWLKAWHAARILDDRERAGARIMEGISLIEENVGPFSDDELSAAALASAEGALDRATKEVEKLLSDDKQRRAEDAASVASGTAGRVALLARELKDSWGAAADEAHDLWERARWSGWEE